MSEEGGALKTPEAVKKKVGPFPLWGWVVLGSGVVLVYLLWSRKGRTSSQSVDSSQQAGAMAGTNPDWGVTTADPLTAQQLLASMQDLVTTMRQSQSPPASSVGTAPQPPSVSNPIADPIARPPSIFQIPSHYVPGTVPGSQPGWFHGPNPGDSGGPGFPGPGFSWVWRWTPQTAAQYGLDGSPQFGATPFSTGGPSPQGVPLANSWEWAWLKTPGDLTKGVITGWAGTAYNTGGTSTNSLGGGYPSSPPNGGSLRAHSPLQWSGGG